MGSDVMKNLLIDGMKTQSKRKVHGLKHSEGLFQIIELYFAVIRSGLIPKTDGQCKIIYGNFVQ